MTIASILADKTKYSMKKFITLAICLTALSSANTRAQIMYTDIMPDVISTKGFPDGGVKVKVLTRDFIFEGGGRAVFKSESSKATCMVVTGAGDLMPYLNMGDEVSPAKTWNVDAWDAPTSTTSYTDKYFGFRVESGADFMYGWFRIDRVGGGALTVKDYAYNSVVNTAIKAGDKGTTSGISYHLLADGQVSVYPNPASGSIFITAETNIARVDLLNVVGATVLSVPVHATSTQMDISGLASGYYIATIVGADNNIIARRKFSKN
jgi:hypothetical protein